VIVDLLKFLEVFVKKMLLGKSRENFQDKNLRNKFNLNLKNLRKERMWDFGWVRSLSGC
jgi:hypothetical protein